jgi:hypothetical protein
MAGRLTTRGLAAAALVAAVLLGHGLGLEQLAAHLPSARDASGIRRIEVAYVQVLQPQAPRPPPALSPAEPRPERLRRLGAAAAAPAASAPAPLAALPRIDEVAMLSLPVPQFADPVPAAPAFEWPPSTRLAYRLQGHFRGELEGRAEVRWVRDGARYQVQMDVVVGIELAPLMSRRVTSEGELTQDGLAPRRYDERTRIGPAAPTFAQLEFDELHGEVALANGRRAAAPAGVQDSASQFVQLAWLFNLQPQRLRAGERIELPLALPRRVGRWVYEVQPQEWLQTPLGALATHALKPRPGSARVGELSVQMWIAPSLQYLPVRIRIEQGSETWIDLLIEEPPMQSAAASRG